MDYIIVFVSAGSMKEAKRIAAGILDKKLAACANIIPGMDSLFWWKNKIDSAKETLVVMKTRKSLFGRLSAEIKKLHSYEVPEIIAVPIILGNKDYLGWIKKNTV